MWNTLFRFKQKEMIFGWFKKVTDPMIGKTVIHFTTHGCQGQCHEFYYFGKIIEPIYLTNNKSLKYYKVEVLKHRSTEKRDGNLKLHFINVPAWYLQKFSENIYVAYD